MPDIFSTYGGNLSLSPTGDIAMVTGTAHGQQRVIRRLMTNPQDYLWNLTYGAGLPEMVGEIVSTGDITGIILSQMLLEERVDQTYPPSVSITSSNDSSVVVQILYVDAITSDRSVLSLPL